MEADLIERDNLLAAVVGAARALARDAPVTFEPGRLGTCVVCGHVEPGHYADCEWLRLARAVEALDAHLAARPAPDAQRNP